MRDGGGGGGGKRDRGVGKGWDGGRVGSKEAGATGRGGGEEKKKGESAT